MHLVERAISICMAAASTLAVSQSIPNNYALFTIKTILTDTTLSTIIGILRLAFIFRLICIMDPREKAPEASIIRVKNIKIIQWKFM